MRVGSVWLSPGRGAPPFIRNHAPNGRTRPHDHTRTDGMRTAPRQRGQTVCCVRVGRECDGGAEIGLTDLLGDAL